MVERYGAQPFFENRTCPAHPSAVHNRESFQIVSEESEWLYRNLLPRRPSVKMPVAPSQTLTKSITYKTNFPFPKASNDNKYDAKLGSEEGRTVTLEACSELMEYQFPVDIFTPRNDEAGRSSHLTLIHDKLNQPIVFTINTEGVSFPTRFLSCTSIQMLNMQVETLHARSCNQCTCGLAEFQRYAIRCPRLCPRKLRCLTTGQYSVSCCNCIFDEDI